MRAASWNFKLVPDASLWTGEGGAPHATLVSASPRFMQTAKILAAALRREGVRASEIPEDPNDKRSLFLSYLLSLTALRTCRVSRVVVTSGFSSYFTAANARAYTNAASISPSNVPPLRWLRTSQHMFFPKG